MEEGAWTGLGVETKITGDRQKMQLERSRQKEMYHHKSQTHYWCVVVQHSASDQLLDALDGKINDTPLLDADTISGPPMTFCFICEQVYEPLLRLRKCPGEPKS